MPDPAEQNTKPDQPDAEVWTIPKEAMTALTSGPSWPAGRVVSYWVQEAP